MCNYQGYEFGAGSYPDSVCIDGKLYDADDCDDEGNLYEPGEDIPCPMCDPKGDREVLDRPKRVPRRPAPGGSENGAVIGGRHPGQPWRTQHDRRGRVRCTDATTQMCASSGRRWRVGLTAMGGTSWKLRGCGGPWVLVMPNVKVSG